MTNKSLKKLFIMESTIPLVYFVYKKAIKKNRIKKK